MLPISVSLPYLHDTNRFHELQKSDYIAPNKTRLTPVFSSLKVTTLRTRQPVHTLMTQSQSKDLPQGSIS